MTELSFVQPRPDNGASAPSPNSPESSPTGMVRGLTTIATDRPGALLGSQVPWYIGTDGT